MYKLSGHTLTRGRWFIPESQPVTIQERDSSSSIQLGPDGPDIDFNDWILDEVQGVQIIWRVKSISDSVDTETRTIELEHAIKTLDDRSITWEVTPETIAGTGATTCTAKQAVQYLLGQQSDWTLGDFEYNVSNPYEFDGETLLDAIGTVSNTLEDCVWEYDMSVYPFKLHIRQRDTSASCEMRADRNLSTLKKTISRSGMYTRIYPVGKNDLKITGEYISKNESTYGRIDHIETDQGKTTEANLMAWAQGLLNRHSKPEVSISISGLELSESTGESLDNLKINKICRVPLPEYGTTINERIVKLQFRDKINEPENINATLANNSADVASIVKEKSRSSGRGAKGQAKQNYLFQANGEHLYYEVFDECGHLHSLLRMTEESFRIAMDNLESSLRSEFLLTAESLRITFENGMSSLRGEFTMTAESLRISFTNEMSSMRGEFTMTAESLRISFTNEMSSVRSEINVQADRISLVVTGTGANAKINVAAIVLGINSSTGESEVRIDAGHVYIGNDKSTTVIQGKLDASTVTGEWICSKISVANSLTVNSILANSINIAVTAQSTSPVATQTYVQGCIWDLQITSNGNNYTLQKKALGPNSATWVDVGTFSRAVSSWSGAWSGRRLRVTVSPQNQHKDYYLYSTLVKSGTASHTTSGSNHYATQTINVYSDDDGTDTDAGTLLLSSSVSILANDVYAVTDSQVDMDTFSMVATSAGSSAVAGRKNMGSITRPSQSSYFLFSIKVHGHTTLAYITLNN